MNRIFLLLLLLITISTSTFSQAPLDSSISEARKMIQTLVEEEQIVGLAITVSLEDSVMWSEGFGYSDLDKEKPIKPDQTLFRIASLSKPLTATILGRLEEEELIDSKASVYTYVPDFPTKAYDFNLWHLATHRSGIRHYKAFEKDNQKPLSIEEGLAKFQKSKLKFEPGTDYLYSSYGYNLLGVAMVQATNTSFPQLLQTYVTTPLGMKHTVPDTGVYDAIQTSGFFKSNGKGKVEEAKSVNYTMKMPSGGLLSTSEDLVTFGNAYVYQRLLRRKTQEEMLTDHPLPNGEKTGYGMGWGLGVDGQGRQILSHTGGNVGSVCKLIVYPESALTLAVVSNTYGIDWLKFIRTVNRIPNMILEEKEDQVKLSKK